MWLEYYPRQLIHLFCKLQSSIDKRVQENGAQYTAFGIFGIFNYPVFYFIWIYLSKQPYSNLLLRTVATILCLGLVLNKYWPQKIKPYLSLYWYLTLTYCLPFFFAFFLVKNNFSSMWLANSILVFYFLILLVDFKSFVFLFLIGTFFGVILGYFSKTRLTASQHIDYFGIIITYLVSFVIGGIFSHNRDKIEQAKLHATKSLGATIAHELRTPLSSIASGVSGLKDYLPALVAGYELAREGGLPVQAIRKNKYQVLIKTLGNIELDTQYANTVINMLLMNAKQKIVQQDTLSLHAMNTCIHEVMENYPFESMEADLVHLDIAYDFEFQGESLLVKHVLLNLLRNALYFIQAEGKGSIQITTSAHGTFHMLSFKDTARGIDPRAMHKIFDRFYTTTTYGTGLGLAFCKMVMKNLGGDINCSSKLGEFTQFDLEFPKINPLKFDACRRTKSGD